MLKQVPPPEFASKKPRIDAVVSAAVAELAPSVRYIRYEIQLDWTGEWAVFFRVVLSGDVSDRKRRQEIITRVIHRLTDELDLPNLGMFPFFDFRSESEQASLKDPDWAAA